MHFLVQIDCAELPYRHPDMPDVGMLFFFARDDEEQCWTEGDPIDSIRVLHAPWVEPDQPRRNAPEGLPPIGGEWSAHDGGVSLRLPIEGGAALHTGWPLVPLRIDSWPDFSTISDTDVVQAFVNGDAEKLRAMSDLYVQRVEALRTGAMLAATLLPTHTGQEPPQWGKTLWGRPGVGAQFVLPTDDGLDPRDFPQLGVMIDRIARSVVCKILSGLNGASEQDHQHQCKLAEEAHLARGWIERAARIGMDDCPEEPDAQKFRAWLCRLGSQESPLHWSMHTVILRAMHSVVIYAMDRPAAAAAIPASFYRQLEDRYLPYTQRSLRQEDGRSAWRITTHFHEMQGYQRSCQDAESLNDEMVLLMQLDSDSALGMGFGDVGSVYFWIGRADLRARQFQHVWVDVIGH